MITNTFIKAMEAVSKTNISQAQFIKSAISDPNVEIDELVGLIIDEDRKVDDDFHQVIERFMIAKNKK